MRITITPDIRYKGLVEDFSRASGNREYVLPFVIESQPFVINIPPPPERIRGRTISLAQRKSWINSRIKRALRRRVRDAVRSVIGRDIGYIAEEEDIQVSPPVKLFFDDERAKKGSLVFDVNAETEWLKNNIDANFQVERTNNRRNQGILWGQERVWKLKPKCIMYHQTDLFYEHSGADRTCAYDYIITKFGDLVGRKKISKNKDCIDRAITLPQDFQKKVYEEWLNLYNDDERLGFNKPNKVHPLPEIIDVEDLNEDLYKVRESRCDIGYNSFEKKTTLSVLDIVKWCIVANVRLLVWDYDGSPYMSYNPNDFKACHNQIKTDNKRTIAVKISNNHAYFIEDKSIKSGASLSQTNYKLDVDATRKTKDDEDKSEEKEAHYIINPLDEISISDECSSGLVIPEGLKTSEDWTAFKLEILTSHRRDLLKKYPPLTFQQLVSAMEDKTTITHYTINKTNLNGFVNWLYKNKRLIPSSMKGLSKVVQVATYKNLKVYCSKRSPPTSNENQGSEFDGLYELYPALKTKWGNLPTPTKIANVIYDSLGKDNILSMLNNQTRRMFYDCEVKANNDRVFENCNEKNYSDYSNNSIDLKRAYTSVLLNNDIPYQVYDSVCQPKKFRGNFKPNYFYLCINLCDGFPCKRGKGLILYHGSLLRHIRDKVVIKYVIYPKKELEPDHFVEFVEKCQEASKLFSPEKKMDKLLINNFIGSLKRKDDYGDFTHRIIDSKITQERALMDGYIPTRLDTTTNSWKFEPLLLSVAKRNFHFHTGNPIRLQVIETINEQMYLLYKHYRVCLYTYQFGLNWMNNIKQRKVLQKIRDKKSVPAKRKSLFNPTPSLVSVRTDALYINSPYKGKWSDETRGMGWNKVFDRVFSKSTETNKFIRYIINKWNEKSDYIVEPESCYEDTEFVCKTQPQLPFTFIPNKWEIEEDINTAWELKTPYDWKLRLIERGGMITGMGGRGKSELINEVKDTFERNRIRYRFVKAVYKVMKKNNQDIYDRMEKWRETNPCFYEVFCPTNKSANRVGGKTFHKGLGIPFIDDKALDDEEEVEEEQSEQNTIYFMETKIDRFQGGLSEDGSYKPCKDFIVVDEVSMANGEILSYLAYIKTRIPRIKFIISGDIPHQLPPIGEEHRDFENSYILKELTGFNKLNLNYNFRIGKSGDVLWDEWSNHPERFTPDKKHKLRDRNLCYTNKTRKEVIELCQNRLVNPRVISVKSEAFVNNPQGANPELKIVLGTPLIAWETDSKSYDYKIAKNEMWYVCAISDTIKLFEPECGKMIEIEEDELARKFLSGYCITIHKSQGETYKDEYTIWDWGRISQSSNYYDNIIKRKLRYVAQSRSSNPEKNISYII